MKLSIQSDILSELNLIIKKEYTRTLRFLFGKLLRTGFSPFLNQWDYNCFRDKLSCRYHHTQFRTGERNYHKICDIGFIVDRQVLLCTVEEDHSGDETSVTVFRLIDYNIILISSKRNYQVEIEFTNKPLNINELFEPVKFLYSLIDNITNFVTEDVSFIVKTEYNNMFGRKQDTPWIIPQGIHFLQEELLETVDLSREYVVMPMYRGKKYMLYLSENGAFLISKNEILVVEKTVPTSLYNTVIVGNWCEKSFTGYDIAFISGIDIRKKSYLVRLKSLRTVSIRFSFCETIRFYTDNLEERITELLDNYDGIIFMPIKANLMNNRVYLYQLIEKVGIRFNIEYFQERGYMKYSLKTGLKQDLFKGTQNLPFYSSIPLIREDRDFIGNLNNKIFEFRWESNGWMPYIRENETTSSKFACKSWEYINNPLDIGKLLTNIRTFKKIHDIKKKNNNGEIVC